MLSQFPFKKKKCTGHLHWNVCIRVFFLISFLINSKKKKKKTLNLEALAHDYLTPTMTVLFHGPPTRGPVMNFCVKAKLEEERNKSRSAAAVSLRLTCILQSSLTSGLLCSERIMKCSASRAPLRPIRAESRLKRALGRERPSTNQRSVPERVYTHRHMARLRCPCERDRGR